MERFCAVEDGFVMPDWQFDDAGLPDLLSLRDKEYCPRNAQSKKVRVDHSSNACSPRESGHLGAVQ